MSSETVSAVGHDDTPFLNHTELQNGVKTTSKPSPSPFADSDSLISDNVDPEVVGGTDTSQPIPIREHIAGKPFGNGVFVEDLDDSATLEEAVNPTAGDEHNWQRDVIRSSLPHDECF